MVLQILMLTISEWFAHRALEAREQSSDWRAARKILQHTPECGMLRLPPRLSDTLESLGLVVDFPDFPEVCPSEKEPS